MAPTNFAQDSVRILLLEDSAPLRRLLAELLCDLPFSVEVVETGDVASALGAVQEALFDFAILDLNIPGLADIKNGIDVAHHIKAQRPQTRVALLTAFSAQTDRDACLEGGADRFYDKGEFEDLLDWLAEEVRARRRVNI